MIKRISVVDNEKCIGCMCCMLACNRRFLEAGYSKSAILVKSMEVFERGFKIIVCRACEDPPCYHACPVKALKKREVGGVILDRDKCIGCKLCIDACPIGAIFWDEDVNKPIICTYCGYCTKYCHYNVIKPETINQ